VVKIKGLEKFAPKDFPGFVSSTVFLGGCNFRCPFCHNADLVIKPQMLPDFPLDYFISYLDSRQDWLEGICVTGGEPLMHDDLEVLLKIIKERNLLVKIDTNGSFPEHLEDLIQKKMIDFVAMDVKAPLERYPEVTHSNVNSHCIEKSISIIMKSGLKYIFRTTVVPGIIDAEDIKKISQLLIGAECLQLQQFMPENTVDRSYLERIPYSKDALEAFAKIAKPYFSEVRLEGV